MTKKELRSIMTTLILDHVKADKSYTEIAQQIAKGTIEEMEDEGDLDRFLQMTPEQAKKELRSVFQQESETDKSRETPIKLMDEIIDLEFEDIGPRMPKNTLGDFRCTTWSVLKTNPEFLLHYADETEDEVRSCFSTWLFQNRDRLINLTRDTHGDPAHVH